MFYIIFREWRMKRNGKKIIEPDNVVIPVFNKIIPRIWKLVFCSLFAQCLSSQTKKSVSMSCFFHMRDNMLFSAFYFYDFAIGILWIEYLWIFIHMDRNFILWFTPQNSVLFSKPFPPPEVILERVIPTLKQLNIRDEI